MWNTETNYNWEEGNYDAYVIQNFNDGTGFMYTENIPITVFAGASHLIAAASATVLLALI